MPPIGKVYNFTDKASISCLQTWKTILTTATKRRPMNYYFRIESGFNKVYNHSKWVENLKSICLHENVKRKGYFLEEKYFSENR